MQRIVGLIGTVLTFTAAAASGQLPPSPQDSSMGNWSFPWADDVPGAVSASSLIDKPAGKDGPVVSRDGHFFAGTKRIKFIGVNIAFGGNFPTHEQADAAAKRLAAFGVNIVRFHHMDNQAFPNGIFADRSLEKLSPEALDRLDYFIAALKRQGVYANLNLHVSRDWGKVQEWPDADKLPGYDKQVDIFHPDLIAANKQYARDLLTHVNAYTKARYAEEPAVAMVEINNEDTIFLWGGEQNLANLPEPYAKMLQQQWNAWLVKKYGSREKLSAAWANGAEPLGAEVLPDGTFISFTQNAAKWGVEQHGGAKMSVKPAATGVTIDVQSVDGTDWHLQLTHANLHLTKGKFYTLKFTASADQAREISVGVSQAHVPWNNLGFTARPKLSDKAKTFFYGFAATTDDDNGRISFALGQKAGSISLSAVSLREGGREGLREGEDAATGSVERGGVGSPASPARNRDWYSFLQGTDEAYFVGMRDWLKTEIGVKAPITGTIGLGMLGTKGQRNMDFVDAHAYWDHPHFPHRQWDMKDWEIKNKPMVDDINGATLWGLAATRVFGKPFTVTEYNHAAPNEWQAECVPMVMAYAALLDWDAVFLFDYVASAKYEKQTVENFFSIEGNVTKLAALPLARRVFDNVSSSGSSAPVVVRELEILDTAPAYFHHQWPFLREVMHVRPPIHEQLSIAFEGQQVPPMQPPPPDQRVSWTASGAGTGQLVLKDTHAAVFVGFTAEATPVDIGSMRLTAKQHSFAAIQLVPAAAGKSLADADRPLLSAIARTSSTGMKWDEKRSTVGTSWGKPPAKIELVQAAIELKSATPLKVWALGPDGKRVKEVPATYENSAPKFSIGSEPTVWYELTK